MQRYQTQFFLLLSFILTLSVIACKEKSQPSENLPDYLNQNTATLAENIDLKGSVTVEASPEAREAVADWPEFTSANVEIEKIKNSSLQSFINNADNLYDAVQKINDSIPEQFNNQPVQSRVNVLKTKVEVLNQDLDRPDLSPEQVNQNARDIYTAFQNLKIQLNEVFLRQLSDLEFDMDSRQDSIQQSRQRK